MIKKEEKIDNLLQRNRAKQLADVDWDGLNAAISARLDKAQKVRISPTLYKIAAVTAAAAAILIILIINFNNKGGSATVAIINPSENTHVKVDIVEKESNRGKCDIQITNLSTTQKKEDKIQPNWFVISKTKSASPNNGLYRDIRDIACLF